VFLPYCGYLGAGIDTIPYLRRIFEDFASGIERPAAVIVSTAQAECGVQIAGKEWLKELELSCREFGVLLILDETLTGCGRTGSFFSFEDAGVKPDMIIVSHAIAGGLPLSLLLLRPDLDRWRHGERAGVFQGDSLSLVAATELLSHWKDDAIARRVIEHGAIIAEALGAMIRKFPGHGLSAAGTGMLWGLDLKRPTSGAVVAAWALELGLVIEASPLKDDVLLLLPPVTIETPALQEGLQRFEQAVGAFLNHSGIRNHAPVNIAAATRPF
jgi:diaminobutyrate-2-oxoglutarate transaminase